jgi:anti-anti-sigma regulatory factor
MKLTLVRNQGIEVLTSTGEISTRDLQVLKAGITQLLKSGKNRIVIDLPEASRIPGEILGEIAQLDLLARQLSGRIVLSGVSAQVREQIARFAQPPVLECFATVADALTHFKPAAAIDEAKPLTVPTATAASAAPPSPAPAAGASAAAAADPNAQTQYKADIREKELAGLHELRARIAELENENSHLLDQLLAAVTARRSFPPQAHEASERLTRLEERLENAIKAASGKPAGPT